MTIQIKRTKLGTNPASLADGELFIDQLNGVLKWADAGAVIQATPLKTGAANGLASLDATGKIPSAQLPAAILGALQYQGTWNAATNSPALTSGIGAKGNFYKVSVAGTTSIDGCAVWSVGDMIVFDGTAWDKIDGQPSEVTSVAGRAGAVTLAVADVSGAAPLASPAFTGAPTAPTPAQRDASTNVATTAFLGQNLPGGLISKFYNGTFDVAQGGTSGSVAAAATAYTLDGWQISATGAAAAWSQIWNTNLAGNSLRVAAASGLTAATLQQRIESYFAAQLLTAAAAAQPITVQFAIYNGMSAPITPTLSAGYASARDNFATVTSDLAATSVQTIAAEHVGGGGSFRRRIRPAREGSRPGRPSGARVPGPSTGERRGRSNRGG